MRTIIHNKEYTIVYIGYNGLLSSRAIIRSLDNDNIFKEIIFYNFYNDDELYWYVNDDNLVDGLFNNIFSSFNDDEYWMFGGYKILNTTSIKLTEPKSIDGNIDPFKISKRCDQFIYCDICSEYFDEQCNKHMFIDSENKLRYLSGKLI